VGDDPEAVRRNREALWSAVAPGIAAPVIAEQVHGAQVAVVGAGDTGSGWRERETAIAATDALVTRERGVPLAILVADCAAVALVAPGGVLGLAHAGWRGLAGGVLEATLERMAALAAAPAGDCAALIGPCIRGCCYEVGEEVWRQFPGECLAATDRPETRRLDLMAAVIHRLRTIGLGKDRIHSVALCASCRSDLFFSHRRATREGLAATGRMALIGWLE
jgi:hypothetical protein